MYVCVFIILLLKAANRYKVKDITHSLLLPTFVLFLL